MRETILIILAFLFGALFSWGWSMSSAQLAPFDAPLDQQLNGQRQEQWLRLERDLERREYSRDPCRR